MGYTLPGRPVGGDLSTCALTRSGQLNSSSASSALAALSSGELCRQLNGTGWRSTSALGTVLLYLKARAKYVPLMLRHAACYAITLRA